MSTYAELTAKIVRLLKESSPNSDLLHDSVCAGLDAILPWVAPRLTQTIDCDGEKKAFALNDGLYEIDAIKAVSSGEFLPPAMLAPGQVRGSSMAGDNNWIEYPTGMLSMSYAPAMDAQLVVFYRGHWDKPASANDGDFELTIPMYLEYPVSLYAAAYCLTSKAAETATVRQFATKVDSGNPEHNPNADRAEFLFKLFRSVMNSYPKQMVGSQVA